MSLEVSIRGVYCSHGDAPEGAVPDEKFLEIEDQNCPSGPGNVLTLRRPSPILVRQYGQVRCDDPMNWLFGPWNGFGTVLCDFNVVCFQN